MEFKPELAAFKVKLTGALIQERIKAVIAFLLIVLFATPMVAQTRYQGLPVIKANQKRISYRVNDELHQDSWNISPELQPDELTVPCKMPVTTVAFYTGLDSITYQITPGQSERFYVLWNGKYALTAIKGVAYVPPAIFSDQYVRAHQGKYFVEVPEVQELVHIAFALTPTGLADKNMVEHSTAYYQEVMQHFKLYSKEPIIAELDKLLQNHLYATLKMDACSFVFKENKIVKSLVYNRLSWGNENTLTSLIPQLEALALKSGFRKFYKNHQNHYAALKQEVEKYMPIKKQWEWCEQHFTNAKYDSYKITFSPLVRGSHSTNRFENNHFSETVMFICPAIQFPEYNEKVAEGLNTRIVFTEIDHNYVNPVSDKYVAQINSVFADRAKWAKVGDSNNYGNPYAIFNEYMTWGVFTLYTFENYSPADFKMINAYTEQMIAQRRGFYRFPEFNQQLLALYQKSTTKKIEDLYPAMLAWSKELK